MTPPDPAAPPRRVPLPLAPADTPSPSDATTVGSYFVSNYPPFSFWGSAAVAPGAGVQESFGRPPSATANTGAAEAPLGLYVHIPYCRKRCHFCYFKVYTEQTADEIGAYLSSLKQELALYARLPAIAGRRPRFVYFGGGTPSYLSVGQLSDLWAGLSASLPFPDVEEVTFECEPGTLSEAKLSALKDLGVTRLSLGIENFNDAILEGNNRAHLEKHALRAYELARKVSLPQVNIDLIAGMIGETDENWQSCIEKTLDLSPDSVTIYQMEVPPNTTIYKDMKARGDTTAPIADWAQKRAWVGQAFAAMEARGYRVSSAYTMVKADAKVSFRYRDCLWTGSDLLGIGVSSFSHVGGVHFQNEKDIALYSARVGAGELPLQRGLVLSSEERLIRELILQLKLGVVWRAPFQEKFGVDPWRRFDAPLRDLEAAGRLVRTDEKLVLSREALLRVDTLLPAFYLPEHRS